jgi:hypothetical protein
MFPLLLSLPLIRSLTRIVAEPLLLRVASARVLARSLARYSPELLKLMVCSCTSPPRISRSPELEISTRSDVLTRLLIERSPELLMVAVKESDCRSSASTLPLELILILSNLTTVKK